MHLEEGWRAYSLLAVALLGLDTIRLADKTSDLAPPKTVPGRTRYPVATAARMRRTRSNHYVITRSHHAVLRSDIHTMKNAVNIKHDVCAFISNPEERITPTLVIADPVGVTSVGCQLSRKQRFSFYVSLPTA